MSHEQFYIGSGLVFSSTLTIHGSLPTAYEARWKVMFSRAFVCSRGGGALVCPGGGGLSGGGGGGECGW